MEKLSLRSPGTPGFAQRLESAEIGISEACIEALLQAHPAAGAVAESLAGGRAFFFGPLSPLSQAVGLGLNGPVTDEEFERLETFFLSRNAPVVISLCPYAHPTLIECIARRRAYRITHFEHTLIRHLTAVESFPLPPLAVVRRVEPGSARLWARTVMNGFHDNESDPPPEAMEDLFAILQSARGASAYLGYGASGEAAGGGSMSIQGDTAMLAGDATLPAFRGRGLQAALIAARLHQAVVAGCTLALACTLPGTVSQRNYERAGFQVAYTKSLLVRDGTIA